MMILCSIIVSLHILIGNTVDGDCSLAYDEYHKGIRKCCDGKFEYHTCFNCKYSNIDIPKRDITFVSKHLPFSCTFVYDW